MIDEHSSGLLDMTCSSTGFCVGTNSVYHLYQRYYLLCNVSDVVKCVIFADDTNIFCLKRYLTDLQLALNRELSKLFVWCSVNKLSLHLSKTNYILFRNRSADNDLNISINTMNVTRVQSSNFLALLLMKI